MKLEIWLVWQCCWAIFRAIMLLPSLDRSELNCLFNASHMYSGASRGPTTSCSGVLQLSVAEGANETRGCGLPHFTRRFLGQAPSRSFTTHRIRVVSTASCHENPTRELVASAGGVTLRSSTARIALRSTSEPDTAAPSVPLIPHNTQLNARGRDLDAPME